MGHVRGGVVSAQYRWRDGARIQADAQATGEWLEKLRVTHGGLTAAIVVEAAHKASSPGHALFKWDDKAAAVEYRLEQARRVLRALEVTVEQCDGHVRKFVVINESGADTYQDLVMALSHADSRAQVLARALSELRAFRAKYAGLKELADVFELIDKK